MKRIVNRLLIGLTLVGLAWQTIAITSDGGANPYQRVVDRNAFGLTPPPPPPGPDVQPPPAPPNQVKLIGFWKYQGKQQAFLKVTEAPKPGAPPKEISMTLDEGGRQGAIEVLAIDVKARTVSLKNSGHMTNLALADFIAKTASPSLDPGPALGIPRPPSLPQPRIVARQPQQPPPQLTPEEQIIVMEVERERAKAAVERGDSPPLPPTPLTPAGAAGMATPELPPRPGS